MSPKITTFLTYNDQAEEAVNLYTSVFPNSKVLSMTRYGEGGPGPTGSVMTASFELDGQEFMALNGGPSFSFAEGISLFVNCETQEDLDELWEKLSKGGEKGPCGWLKDRFGVSWQIVPRILGEMLGDKDSEKSKRVMNAMLQMSKIDIQGLKRARAGIIGQTYTRRADIHQKERRMTNNSASATRAENLKVPGASIYYEVCGSGPVLLMIPGGPADAGAFSGIAGLLADRYTVVTYDPRGNSRSKLDGPPDDQKVEVHADDAHRLLAAVGAAPAFVLGSSGGAVVGLELVARHPEQVNTLVAHEPPVLELLPDNARWRAFNQEVYDTYRKDGVGPAMQKFGAGMGLEDQGPPAEPSPEMMEGFARMGGNLEFFVAHLIRPVSGYVPDIEALRAAPARIVVAAGEESRAKPWAVYEASVALAERLGTDVVHFPGHHGGFGTHPGQFAETLRKVLAGG